jgi:aryl-alcohol dehydrogenase-like predicted oxidoreductase
MRHGPYVDISEKYRWKADAILTSRKLGSSGLEISPIVLGCSVFGWTIDEKTSFEVLDAFFDSGLNTIDTADMYSSWVPGHIGGESEAIIGNWIKSRGNRNDLVIATKVGKELKPNKRGLAKAYILKAVEDSLTRLKTDYIDLYQSHEDDISVPFEETFEAFELLIEQGKVRVIGASNYSPERLTEAIEFCKSHNLPVYQTLQPEYNLCERAGYETDLEAIALKYGLGVITYSSLAFGFLTGKYRSEADLGKSVRSQDAKKYLNPKGIAILGALDKIAKSGSSTPAEVALAWLMARPSVSAPIAAASNVNQTKVLARAASLTLDSSEVALLDKASAG